MRNHARRPGRSDREKRRALPADRPKAMVYRGAFAPPSIDGAAIREEATARLEAALFAADEPLTPRRLCKLAGLEDTGEVRRQAARLNRALEASGAPFRVEEIAGGYQLLTRPELRGRLDRLCRVRECIQLSPPTLETLAIVAYRQPICRADIEAIRGVQVGEILRQLLERGLVRIVGREDSLGRPFLYGTTKYFLRAFGLRNLHELPLVELLRRPQDPPVPPKDSRKAAAESDESGDS